MKPTKAIEILDEYLKPVSRYEEPDFRDAIQLGKEALKFCEKYKAMIMQPSETLLPGEDPE